MKFPGRSIPYEPQCNREGMRRCGAAALCMVYRSFGIAKDQILLFEEMGRSNRTFQLARHAVRSGYLEALIVRFRDPWEGLLRLRSSDAEIRVILNHRLRRDAGAGHFSVLVELDCHGKYLVIHDPQFGPSRRLEKDHFMELWQPGGEHCEIRGGVAVLFSKDNKTSQQTDQTAAKNGRFCDRCSYWINFSCFAGIIDDCSHYFCPLCDRPFSV
ncbi:MAG TPA: hypothetical protein DEB39_13365 [Planctomycetaceae bacterium]|nr:hypothetical protein [Planctomycetaceae bacterium]